MQIPVPIAANPVRADANGAACGGLPGELLVALCCLVAVAGIAFLTTLPMLIALQNFLAQMQPVPWPAPRLTATHTSILTEA